MKRSVNFEQFFTKEDLAKKCVDFTLEHIKNIQNIIEPSAGGGVFLKFLPKNTISMDILPLNDQIKKQDFLKYSPQLIGKTLVIGNPPFGARASLARKFILHSAKFADVIAFILPRSFNKSTFQKFFPKNYHLINWFLCEDFETPSGVPVKIKCVFQIWEKRDTERYIQDTVYDTDDFILKHAHFSQKTSSEIEYFKSKFDYKIPQVGTFKLSNASDFTSGSYWFIKIKNQVAMKYLEKLNFDFLNNCNSMFMSRSKNDILRAYNEAKSKFAKENNYL